MRALVVDDSKVTRMILHRILDDFGYGVEEAANGREGLQKAEGISGDLKLVLADWNMPEMNGLEMVRNLRKNPVYRSTAIIMVTTETEIDRVVAALAAGANEYVMKPFTKEILAEKLRLAGLPSQG